MMAQKPREQKSQKGGKRYQEIFVNLNEGRGSDGEVMSIKQEIKL